MNKQTLFIYSLIAMPLSIVGIPLYIYLPTFYATNTAIDIATVGVVLFIARVTDVFTDPYIGYLSDESVQKYGSRKPIVFIGSFILSISFYFLVNPSSVYTTLWLGFFSIFVYLGWSMVSIPYLTWSSELSKDYYEKTKLNSFREFSTIVGLLLALVVPYSIASEYELQGKLNILFLFFICLFIPFVVMTLYKLDIKNKPTISKFDFQSIKLVYEKIPNLKNLQLGFFFNSLANAIPATLFLLFIESVIGQKDFSGLVLILYFLAGIFALPFWTILSKKIGKKSVWVSSIILATLSFVFVVFLREGDLVAFGIISFISGLSLGADIAFPTSIQADVVQKVQTIKENISGIIFGIWTMITKISLATSVLISFGVLGLVDFDKENLTSTSILTLILLYGILPVFFKFIALFFISKYKENIN